MWKHFNFLQASSPAIAFPLLDIEWFIKLLNSKVRSYVYWGKVTPHTHLFITHSFSQSVSRSANWPQKKRATSFCKMHFQQLFVEHFTFPCHFGYGLVFISIFVVCLLFCCIFSIFFFIYFFYFILFIFFVLLSFVLKNVSPCKYL